jgi:threonine dehydratase
LRAGRIIKVPEEPTISESTAGGVEDGSITFPLCQQLIDERALVSETEIREAMRLILDKERWIIEGSAGVAVAAYLKERERFAGQNVALILCGRNISSKNLTGIL